VPNKCIINLRIPAVFEILVIQPTFRVREFGVSLGMESLFVLKDFKTEEQNTHLQTSGRELEGLRHCGF